MLQRVVLFLTALFLSLTAGRAFWVSLGENPFNMSGSTYVEFFQQLDQRIAIPIAITGIGGTFLAGIAAAVYRAHRRVRYLLLLAFGLSTRGERGYRDRKCSDQLGGRNMESPCATTRVRGPASSMVAMASGAVGWHDGSYRPSLLRNAYSWLGAKCRLTRRCSGHIEMSRRLHAQAPRHFATPLSLVVRRHRAVFARLAPTA